MVSSVVASKRITGLLLLIFVLECFSDVGGQANLTYITTACVQWTSYVNQNSLGGINFVQYKTLADCQAFCSSRPTCVALDFDQTSNPCWIHDNPRNLIADNTYNLIGVTQFIISRSCETTPNCYQWMSYENQNSLFATNYPQFKRLSDCQAFCLSIPQCVAVDYETSSASPCWVHTSASNLLPVNTFFLTGRIQYRLSRLCSAYGCVQWSVFNGQNSIFGVNYPTLINLADCLSFCESKPLCVAIDYDNTTAPCWLHLSADDLTPDNTYPGIGVTQYRGSRTCETLSCAQWTSFQNRRSTLGIQYFQYTNVADCLQFCVVTSQCLGVDFGFSSCWIHIDDDDFSSATLIAGWTQYILNRTCTPTTNGCVQWSSYVTQNSLNGFPLQKYKTLADCLEYCAANPLCVAVDYDTSAAPCWVHLDTNNLTPENTFNLPGITQFIISRSCSFSISQWTAYPAQNSVNGISYPQYKTLEACQDACSSTIYCLAIDYDSSANPCYLHLYASDLFANNTYQLSGVTQYIISRTFPLTTITATTTTSTSMRSISESTATITSSSSSSTAVPTSSASSSPTSTTTITTRTSPSSTTRSTTTATSVTSSPTTRSTTSTSASTSSTTTRPTSSTTAATTANAACVWTSFSNTNAPGGTAGRYLDLASCQDACIQTLYCIGIDIDSNQGASSYCWLTVGPQASGALAPYPNSIHYTLTRTTGCPLFGLTLPPTTTTSSTQPRLDTVSGGVPGISTTVSSGCNLLLTINSNSDGATILGTMNETSCVLACLAIYPSCLAVDYNAMDRVCYSHSSTSGRKWNSCCRRYEYSCSVNQPACNSSLVSYRRLIVVSSAGAQPIASVRTVGDCQSACLTNPNCTGLMWISSSSVVPSGLQQCTIYTQLITATTTTTDTSFTTFVRQTCVPLPAAQPITLATQTPPPAAGLPGGRR